MKIQGEEGFKTRGGGGRRLCPRVSPCISILTDVEHVDMRERVEGLGRQDVSVGEENVVLIQLISVHTAFVAQQP